MGRGFVSRFLRYSLTLAVGVVVAFVLACSGMGETPAPVESVPAAAPTQTAAAAPTPTETPEPTAAPTSSRPEPTAAPTSSQPVATAAPTPAETPRPMSAITPSRPEPTPADTPTVSRYQGRRQRRLLRRGRTTIPARICTVCSRVRTTTQTTRLRPLRLPLRTRTSRWSR